LVATVAADATRWLLGAKRLTTRTFSRQRIPASKLRSRLRLILSYFLFNIGKSHVYRVLD
jgi:hypothetical protein